MTTKNNNENMKGFLSWWRGEARWLSIMMGVRVERRTLVKLAVVWVLFIGLIVQDLTTDAVWNVWTVLALVALGALTYSAAVDLSEIDN